MRKPPKPVTLESLQKRISSAATSVEWSVVIVVLISLWSFWHNQLEPKLNEIQASLQRIEHKLGTDRAGLVAPEDLESGRQGII